MKTHPVATLSRRGVLLLPLPTLLAGCGAWAPPALPGADVAASAWAAGSGAPGHGPAQWAHHPFPGKRPTYYRPTRRDGRDAIEVTADASASMLRTPLRVEPAALGRLRFSWRVPALLPAADLGLRDHDDTPVRIVLAFEGDRRRFSQRDALLSELAQAVTGEPMPYATLMYVWCNTRAPETVVPSPRTGRIRKIVVESGAARLDRWLAYERDVRTDYAQAFGEAPGALVGLGIMSDTDNTRARSQAWYGPVQVLPPA